MWQFCRTHLETVLIQFVNILGFNGKVHDNWKMYVAIHLWDPLNYVENQCYVPSYMNTVHLHMIAIFCSYLNTISKTETHNKMCSQMREDYFLRKRRWTTWPHFISIFALQRKISSPACELEGPNWSGPSNPDFNKYRTCMRWIGKMSLP